MNRKKLIYICASILGAIIILALGLFIYNQIEIAKEHHQEEVAEQQAIKVRKEKAQLEKKKEKNFDEAFDSFSANASATAVADEKIGGAIYKTWEDAVFNDSVTVDGKSYTDFEKAITAKYSQLDKQGEVDTAEQFMQSTKSDYSKLKKNLTNRNNDRFQKADDFYSSLKKFHSLCTNPTGSFKTYSDTYNQLDSDLGSKMSDF